jgi:PKD repeat protein
VTLTVTDPHGVTASVSDPVDVVGPPSPAFSVTTASPTASSPVGFDGSGSHEAGGSISSYSWNFGDGSAAGSGVTTSQTYAVAGSYTVTLTVTDANGATASTTTTVNAVSPRITSVSVKKGKKIEKLTLIISGPGALTVGKRRFNIKQAGSFVYKLKLSKAQRNRLKHHHSLKIKVTFKFQPTVGSSSTRKVSFKVKG